MAKLTLLLVALLGCSSVSSEEQTGALDSSVADGATVDSSSSDTATADSTASDAPKSDITIDTPPGDTGTCHAFWCGCGSCVPADIICTRKEASCPLGCPVSACPDLERTDVCTTEVDHCRRNGISGDIACLSTADCPTGMCCSGTFTPPSRGKCAAC